MSEEFHLAREFFDKTKNTPSGKLKLDLPNYVMGLVLKEGIFFSGLKEE